MQPQPSKTTAGGVVDGAFESSCLAHRPSFEGSKGAAARSQTPEGFCIHGEMPVPSVCQPMKPDFRYRSWPIDIASQRFGEALSAELPADDDVDPFTGRWLVLSDGGDCLADCSVGACDALRDLPLGKLCGLAAAILQFITGVCGNVQQEAANLGLLPDSSVHAMVLGGFRLSACRAPPLSVVAATPVQSGLLTEAAGGHNTAIMCKVVEVHTALLSDLNPAMEEFAAAAEEHRKEKEEAYTLSSMLDSGLDAPDDALAAAARCPKAATGTQAALNLRLQRPYSRLLSAAFAVVGREAPHGPLEGLHLLDRCLRHVARAPFSPDPRSAGDDDLVRAATAAALSLKSIGGFTLWRWAEGCPGNAQGARTSISAVLLGPSAGPLRVGALLRCEASAYMQLQRPVLNAPVAALCIGGLDGKGALPKQLVAEAWAVAEVTRHLAHAFAVPFEWPSEAVHRALYPPLNWDKPRPPSPERDLPRSPLQPAAVVAPQPQPFGKPPELRPGGPEAPALRPPQLRSPDSAQKPPKQPPPTASPLEHPVEMTQPPLTSPLPSTPPPPPPPLPKAIPREELPRGWQPHFVETLPTQARTYGGTPLPPFAPVLVEKGITSAVMDRGTAMPSPPSGTW